MIHGGLKFAEVSSTERALFPRIVLSNVSIFKLIGVRVTLRRFNETNSLIAV